MVLGPPLPLSPDAPLAELLASACGPGQLGAWLRDGPYRLRVYDTGGRSPGVVVSRDLGLLLRHCSHVALRQVRETVVLAADAVIEWRALQVVTATPCLPGVERLRAQFPGLSLTTNGFLIPVRKESPEEVLALCLEEGLRVGGSRIVYARAEEA